MEKKQRVPKGGQYFYVGSTGIIKEDWDELRPIDNERFETGNYFPGRESAKAMAEKLRAVLKGADVIEMPSEEEYEKIIPQRIGCSDEFAAGEGNGYWRGYNYIQSKIVK